MKNFFYHLFLPRHTNNFRAKILHHSYIAFFTLAFFFFTIGIQYVKTNHPQVLGISYSISVQELLDATNRERVANGLSPLSLNSSLNHAAAGKAQHMISNNYWAHFAPDGTTPWVFIRNAGYNYTFAGENLAKGFTNSSDVVAAWMNSASHRENILSQKYKEVGFAVIEGNLEGEDTVLVVQIFGSTSPASIAAAPQMIEKPQEVKQQVQGEPREKIIREKVLQEHEGRVVNDPIVDVKSTTKNVGIILVTILTSILIIDLLIVERKKIPRITGHNLDHIILFLLFGLFIILERGSGIL